MKRLLLSVAVAAAVTSAVPVQAADSEVPTALTAHHVVMIWDGLNGAWFFGELSTILVDARTGDGIQGQTIKFTQGGNQFCAAVTDASGVAKCTDPAAQLTAVTGGGYAARFDGTEAYLPSSASAKLARIAGTEI